MDLNELKIKSKDFTGKDVASLPAHPSADGMSAEELQAAFDRSVKEVIAPKVNSLIDAVAAIQVGGVTPDGELLTSEKIAHSVAGTPTGGTVSDYLAQSMAHQSNYNNPHRVTKSTIGLSNVDNTSDANKPLSIAAKQAIDKLATKDEVALKVDKSALDGLGGGRKFAHAVIGTRTAGWTEKDCDYLCDGADDQVEFQKALDAVPKEGVIYVLPGEYMFSASVTKSDSIQCTLMGTPKSYIKTNRPRLSLFKAPHVWVVIDGICFGGINPATFSSAPAFIEASQGEAVFKNIVSRGTNSTGYLYKSTASSLDVWIINCAFTLGPYMLSSEGTRTSRLCIIGSFIDGGNQDITICSFVYIAGSRLEDLNTLTTNSSVNIFGSDLRGTRVKCSSAVVAGSRVISITGTHYVTVSGSHISSASGGKKTTIEGCITI